MRQPFPKDGPLSPLARIEVGDSVFYGFIATGSIENGSDAALFQKELKKAFPDAAHVAYAWRKSNDEGCNDDGEPDRSAGAVILDKLTSCCDPQHGVVVAIVRFFGHQLLGVTCGRLSACYAAITDLTVHRHFHPTTPYLWEDNHEELQHNVYALAAGDCELHVDILSDSQKHTTRWTLFDKLKSELKFDGFQGAQGEPLPRLQNLQATMTHSQHHARVIPVYRYPGNYHGDQWTTFPWTPTSLTIKNKVQSLLSTLPILTPPASPPQPQQHHQQYTHLLNHCVTNYYRHGQDFIAHHSDKTLDLHPQGIIVSLSLGSPRVFELKRRRRPVPSLSPQTATTMTHPQIPLQSTLQPQSQHSLEDVYRVTLPHGSMLVLGPKTNAQFTHAILPMEETATASANANANANANASASASTPTHEAPKNKSNQGDMMEPERHGARMSLTLRHVTTFLDVKTGRLFGQGVECPSLLEARRAEKMERGQGFGMGAAASAAAIVALTRFAKERTGQDTNSGTQNSREYQLGGRTVVIAGVVMAGTMAVHAWWCRSRRKQREERLARDFFSKTSSLGTKY